MRVGDPLRDRQTQTRAFHLTSRRIGPVKALEDTMYIGCRNSAAVILDGNEYLVCNTHHHNFDASWRLCILCGIVQENPHQTPKTGVVRPDRTVAFAFQREDEGVLPGCS